MKRSTFKVLFYLKRDKEKKDGCVPLFCRIKGFKNKHKKDFDAALIFDENYLVRYEFPEKKGKK